MTDKQHGGLLRAVRRMRWTGVPNKTAWVIALNEHKEIFPDDDPIKSRNMNDRRISYLEAEWDTLPENIESIMNQYNTEEIPQWMKNICNHIINPESNVEDIDDIAGKIAEFDESKIENELDYIVVIDHLSIPTIYEYRILKGEEMVTPTLDDLLEHIHNTESFFHVDFWGHIESENPYPAQYKVVDHDGNFIWVPVNNSYFLAETTHIINIWRRIFS